MKIPWVVFVHDSVFLVLGTMICRDSNIIQGFLGMLQQTHRSTVGNLLFLIFPRNLGEEWENLRRKNRGPWNHPIQR